MNKEKQIEEMKDIVHNLWDKLNQDAITTNDIVNALYNAGYRKLPEDSVVLSREELSKRDYEFRQIGYDECLRDNPKKDKYIKTLERKIDQLNAKLDQASKATAERDFCTIIKALEERKERVKAFYGIAEKTGIDMAISEVKRLAEQFGVEIKE